MVRTNEETRWQSFRQVNRNRPLKQLRIIATTCLCVAAYSYALLGCQSRFSIDQVLVYNTKMAEKKHEEWVKGYKKRVELREAKHNKTKHARLRAMEQRWDPANAARFAMESKNGSNRSASFSSNSTEGLVPFPSKRKKGPPPSTSEAFSNLFVGFVILQLFFRFLRQRIEGPERQRFLASRGRGSQAARQAALRAFAVRLNHMRARQGEPPLSMESLRLVLRNRELNDGNDYEGLLRFNEESGPSVQTLIQSMGATEEEIQRCPHRTLQEGDDLLIPQPGKGLSHCAVCLEAYALQEQVRTIPCFHTFHSRCIDPWLRTKAECPVCKYPAVA